MESKTVNIGLIGFGTVGAGVAKILLESREQILAKTGIELNLKRVVDLDTTSKRAVSLPEEMLSDDLEGLLNDESIEIGIELIGGTTAAKTVEMRLLEKGKHVVTANKALLAEFGDELNQAAKKARRCIAFEASCVGGVPIISALRTGLAANRIRAMYGILNGTCNYILTNMTQKGEAFSDVLAKAKEKGYAEADPTLDINGGDTAHKIAILARLAFGCEINYSDVSIEGIENTSIDDIRYAHEMGYELKLLAIAERTDSDEVSLRVHPSFVSKDLMLSRVDGAFNAISVFGDAVGQTMYYGRGAGMMPTASAVVADLIEVAMGNSQKLFFGQKITTAKMRPIDEIVSRFYIRLMCADEPGVFAQIGQILARRQISIKGLLQHEGKKGSNRVPVIITTHPNPSKNITQALEDIAGLDVVEGTPVCIPIIDIPEDGLDD